MNESNSPNSLTDEHKLAAPKRKRRLSIGFVLLGFFILLIAIVILYSICDPGYKKMPVASTCEEFKLFAEENFPKHMLVADDNGHLLYGILDYQASFNNTSFVVTFEDSGELIVPVTEQQLNENKWMCYDEFYVLGGYGRLYPLGTTYVNAENQAILVYNNTVQIHKGTYNISSLKLYPQGMQGSEGVLGESIQLDSPSFDICNGINKFSTLDKIIECVGNKPLRIEFYENGDYPYVVLTYTICKNSVFQDGYLEFLVDTKRNTIHSIEIKKVE